MKAYLTKKIILLLLIFAFVINMMFAQNGERLFTQSFDKENCTFLTTGRNKYFILEPGYELVLEGLKGQDKERLVITVLNETKKINNIETRIVEEHESINGEVVEISKNFFAICKQTGSIFYFGEEVDIYKNGKIVSHSGAWIAEGNNKAGIIIPGQVLIGSRYYQEIAPKIAMDRAEIISNTETQTTKAGQFANVLKIEETTPLEPLDIAHKLYAPEVGLIKDGDLWLIKYGFK